MATLTGTTVTLSSSPVRAARPCSMPAASRAAEIAVGLLVVDDDGHVALGQLGGHLGRGLGDGDGKLAARLDGRDDRRRVADAHGARRVQLWCGGPQDAIGERHDLRRDAVADRQPDDPGRLAVGEMGEHVIPAGGRQRTRRLGEVADDGHRAVQRAAGRHLELHRRQVLHLVDDDVPVRADLVGVVGLTATADPWAQDLPCVVEQRDVRRRPPDVVDVLGRVAGGARRARRR